jgi:hypothetical protein
MPDHRYQASVEADARRAQVLADDLTPGAPLDCSYSLRNAFDPGTPQSPALLTRQEVFTAGI